jgi:hypothetical protein
MKTDDSLRAHVLELLEGGHAHPTFEKAIAGLPAALRGKKPEGLPHTAWRLLEHMRIAQWDIRRFCIDPRHVSPEFPAGYWPETDAPPSPRAWTIALEAFRSDSGAMKALVADTDNDLFKPIKGGQGQTLLREALLLADHNAYHIGQLITLRRLLGTWKES